MVACRFARGIPFRLVLGVLLFSPVGARAQSPATVEFFEKKIRPLFDTHCLECHGAKGKVRGGLKMTSREELLKGGDTGPSLVPGSPEKSFLMEGVHYKSDALKMPPKGKLAASEIADLEKWIKEGAVWPSVPKKGAITSTQTFSDEQRKFWSFQPLIDSPIPTINGKPPRHAIDGFLRQKLTEKGLQPAKPADRRTLIRRLTYDLTGLPPTPSEVAAFLGDTSPNAVEKLVDRLLESPHFGEAWGRHWLDIARYADSNGLDENTAFGNAWRYRDYVVRSFNNDKPYDEFLREQIAGDLLPDAGSNPDRLTGTGFLVLGPKLLAEPDKQKMKLDIADEQLDTLGKAVLGMTFGCARCHDHKFDPILQRDYYGMLSIFTSTRTMQSLSTVARTFERQLPSEEPLEQTRAREQKLAQKQAELDRATEKLQKQFLDAAYLHIADYMMTVADSAGEAGKSRMARRAKVANAIVLEAENFQKGTADKDSSIYGQGVGIIISFKPDRQRAEYEITVPQAGTYDLELRYAAKDSRPVRIEVNGKLVFAKAAKEKTGGWMTPNQAWHAEGKVTLQAGKNTLAIQAHGLLPHIDKLALLPPNTADTRPPLGTLTQLAKDRKILKDYAESWEQFLGQVSVDDPVFGPWLAVKDLSDADFAKLAPERLRKFEVKAPTELWKGPPKSLAELAARYATYLTKTDTGLARLRQDHGPFAISTPLPSNPEMMFPKEVAQIFELTQEKQAILKLAPAPLFVLSVEEGAKYPEVKGDGKPRNLFLQIRGNYLTPGEEVPATFPRIMMGEKQVAVGGNVAADAPNPEPNQTRYGASRTASGRLELAQWVTAPKNTLTTRVWANRVWLHLMGEGLVRSPDNFGLLGERPTHPQLLDWLALRLVDDGWSTKKLIRRMVLSDAYQMSSVPSDQALAVDADNRLWWRMPRKRLEAEKIRDAILTMGGNIDLKVGGSLLNNGNFTYINNEHSTNTARYDNDRRSIYLPVIRNTLYDFFQIFDFAEPHVPNGQRSRTVVSPQALYMMNNPLVQKEAKLWSELLAKAKKDESARIQLAYEQAFTRPAADRDVQNALEFLARYESSLMDKPAGERRQEAWIALCQALLASNEFIYLD
jgi:mono/diheme cytochrome c family protein